jgi:hypothetical protein
MVLADCDEQKIYGPDRLDWDSDSDGLADGGELAAGSDPINFLSRT